MYKTNYYIEQSIKSLNLFNKTGDIEHFKDAEYFFKELKVEMRLAERYRKIDKLKGVKQWTKKY